LIIKGGWAKSRDKPHQKSRKNILPTEASEKLPQYCEGFGNTIVGEGKAKVKRQKVRVSLNSELCILSSAFPLP
jgi:hypothetical protein